MRYMHYAITLEDGTLADETFGGEPLEFVMGDGTLDESLELPLIGLKPGQEQTVGIDPDQGFGYPDPDAVQEMPRADLQGDFEIEPGMLIEFITPGDETVAGRVVSMNDEVVTVDFNHPLAGHALTYRVEILDVQSAD
ncbi:MAG: peptidylprolyl isomerase [Gammaproteobacteria bacterium]